MIRDTYYRALYVNRSDNGVQPAPYGKGYVGAGERYATLGDLIKDAMGALRAGVDGYEWRKTKAIHVEAENRKTGRTRIVRKVQIKRD